MLDPLYVLDLINWTFKSHIFGDENFPTWATDRFYAPELHFVQGKYVLYYAAGKSDGKHAIGAAIALSDNPFGNFKVCFRTFRKLKVTIFIFIGHW